MIYERSLRFFRGKKKKNTTITTKDPNSSEIRPDIQIKTVKQTVCGGFFLSFHFFFSFGLSTARTWNRGVYGAPSATFASHVHTRRRSPINVDLLPHKKQPRGPLFFFFFFFRRDKEKTGDINKWCLFFTWRPVQAILNIFENCFNYICY